MWKKPMVYLVPAAAAALYCAVCLGHAPSIHIAIWALILSLIVTGAVVTRPRIFFICCILTSVSFAFSFFAVYEKYIIGSIRNLKGNTLEITATVVQDADVYDDNQRAELSIDANDRIIRSFHTLSYLPLTDEPLHAGDKITAYLSFYLPNNTGGFDRVLFQAADRCYVAASCPIDKKGVPYSFSVSREEENSLRWLPNRIFGFCKRAISQALPAREAGLLSGILLGDTSGITEDDTVALRIAGLSHLTAVSGLHIGFLVAFCFLVFGRRTGMVVSVPLVLLFVPIAGARPSVLRAAIMYLITAGAFAVQKEADSLNSLCIALALLLLMNPYAIASLGLQLSFTSTAGLILLAGRMQRRLLELTVNWSRIAKKIASFFAGAVSCTVCATLFTTPILLMSFGSVSILSVLSNTLVAGVTAICFIGGFILCFCAIASVSLAAFVGKLLLLPLRYLLWVAHTVTDLPFGRIDSHTTFRIVALGLFFVILLLWLLLRNRVKWKVALPLFSALIVGCIVADAQYQRTHYTVTYFPCGAGQAIIVSNPHTMALIDCGGDSGYYNAASQIREWMRWNSISEIDTLILTAVDKTHARNLSNLLETTEVNTLLIPDNCKETKNNKDLLTLVRSHNAQPVSEQQTISSLPLTVFPVTDGKLGVIIGGHTLILHSATQKQLATFLEQETITAPLVVLSERNLQDADLLSDALRRIQAESVLLQASRNVPQTLAGLPVESPYLLGDIQKQYQYAGEGTS